METTEKLVQIPVHVVRNANKHAEGAIAELTRQLETAQREEKKAKLRRQIANWTKVLSDTETLLSQVKDETGSGLSASPSNGNSTKEDGDRRAAGASDSVS